MGGIRNVAEAAVISRKSRQDGGERRAEPGKANHAGPPESGVAEGTCAAGDVTPQARVQGGGDWPPCSPVRAAEW